MSVLIISIWCQNLCDILIRIFFGWLDLTRDGVDKQVSTSHPRYFVCGLAIKCLWYTICALTWVIGFSITLTTPTFLSDFPTHYLEQLTIILKLGILFLSFVFQLKLCKSIYSKDAFRILFNESTCKIIFCNM